MQVIWIPLTCLGILITLLRFMYRLYMQVAYVVFKGKDFFLLPKNREWPKCKRKRKVIIREAKPFLVFGYFWWTLSFVGFSQTLLGNHSNLRWMWLIILFQIGGKYFQNKLYGNIRGFNYSTCSLVLQELKLYID